MFKTFNGRPAKVGSMYFEQDKYGGTARKFCLGYCDCGKKLGMTREELKEFAKNMPGIVEDFIYKLVNLKILLPK